MPIQATTIDAALFVARGHDVRSFRKTARIEAPAERVFCAFTDGDAFADSYDPSRPEIAANIDLAIGGRYEWLWDGTTGSNGCQVLSFIPGRMVSFSWNSPPTLDTRELRTWVVVEFADVGGGTEVTLTHLGFGEGEAWDQTLEYFQNAWDIVLGKFAENLGR